GQKIATESTNKLLEKNADNVVIEISGTMEMLGQKRPIPAQKQTIPAKIEKQNITETGAEKVEAAGKSFDCKVYEMANQDPKTQGAKAKVWFANEVPGGVVKMEASMDQGSVKSTLKAFEKK
ncbi:MAG: hypothetical protein ABIP55_04780, partial [Tepidisphaeraceae bacterium]